ncbi:RagB/SusD family nutrient uptake outer membrane protein [Olivibacter domesticus]|uniref:Starch-binding associating with outer membrane n=1 Tax=Olivibacter domesticus TaxID=407022 RepID=A0A1H7W219_OLID1|nr:RagB/SusD family nutrient uptake outer membrane protein [Olivibacter domesticus]SEM15531.1 Starch-binding associating with outer membrane [Olivibacter domesticus]
MKTIKYNITTLLLILLLAACNNDLDEMLYTEVTDDQLTYTNAYQATGVLYANMRELFDHHNWAGVQETSSDELVMPANASGWDDGGIYKRIHLHTWNSENEQMNAMWNSLYKGAINANRIISLLEENKIPLTDGLTKEGVLAEVKIARAFFYWLICDNFGDAPLVTSTGTELQAKSSRTELYQFIVSEVNAALPNLSEDNSRLLYGRFNKWAAKALLANVYLNAGVYTGTPAWQECIQQCDDVINSAKYSLNANFRDVFTTQNENSPEIVFAIPFEETVGGGFLFHMFSWHASLKAKANMQATPWGSGSAMAVPQFIDTYDPLDGRLADTWLMGPQFAADGKTPLLGAYDQAGKPLVFTKDIPDGLYTGESEGYRMNKFTVKMGALHNLDNDFPFFRYADILLMKAECLLRNGNPNEASTLVSQVRARAFKNNPAKATVTGNDLQQNSRYKYGYVEDYKLVDEGNTAPVQYGRLLDELGWEFAWEGHRRRDMIRFGIFTTKSWLSHKPNGDYRITFPIPQQTINSNPNLTQNQGY